MVPFEKIADGVNMGLLQQQLADNPQLWGEHGARKDAEGSPHSEMIDIWARYNRRDLVTSDIAAEHESVWYPGSLLIPEVRRISYALMSLVEGERLGGVLLTKTPAGGKIDRHVDGGWHAEYYTKYYVAVKSEPGTQFYFEADGKLLSIEASTGDIYRFRNDIPHGVFNCSEADRIAMVVCIRHTNT